MGTGGGQSVLRRAAREPQKLFVGVDADARAMAESSRRAARNPARGGLANAIFLAAAAEELPDALEASADAITIALPWGSLLRAVMSPCSPEFAGIAATLKPRGEMTFLLSTSERDA